MQGARSVGAADGDDAGLLRPHHDLGRHELGRAQVAEAEVVDFPVMKRRPVRRRREVVHDEDASGRHHVDDRLRIAALATTIAEEQVKGRMFGKERPVPREHLDARICCMDAARRLRSVGIGLDGHEPSVRAETGGEPGGPDADAGPALSDQALRTNSSQSREEPARLKRARQGEPGGDRGAKRLVDRGRKAAFGGWAPHRELTVGAARDGRRGEVARIPARSLGAPAAAARRPPDREVIALAWRGTVSPGRAAGGDRAENLMTEEGASCAA